MSNVKHPKHYNLHPSGVECITVIQDMTFNVGTAIKHLWRAGLKSSETHIEDLEKARQYIDFEIARIKGHKAFAADASPGYFPLEPNGGIVTTEHNAKSFERIVRHAVEHPKPGTEGVDPVQLAKNAIAKIRGGTYHTESAERKKEIEAEVGRLLMSDFDEALKNFDKVSE
jgi:predicted DNA-binding protein